MKWFWLAIGVGIVLAIVRALGGNKQVAEESAPKPRKAGGPEAADAHDAAPAPDAPDAAPAIPPTWGWAKVHLAAAPVKALGYYYRDAAAGHSFKILVDLEDGQDDQAIRDAARAKKYVASSTFRLGAHETIYATAREGEGRADREAKYERGEGVTGPHCAIVMLLTEAEKRIYELPDAMPNIEIYAKA